MRVWLWLLKINWWYGVVWYLTIKELINLDRKVLIFFSCFDHFQIYLGRIARLEVTFPHPGNMSQGTCSRSSNLYYYGFIHWVEIICTFLGRRCPPLRHTYEQVGHYYFGRVPFVFPGIFRQPDQLTFLRNGKID